jgi:type II secretory pathway component PulJ
MSKCQPLRLKNKKGFTLLEILVAISLSFLLLEALYGVYITSYKSYTNSIAEAELNQNARIAMERITRDLRQTPEIVTVLPPNDTDPLNPSPSEIQFQDGHNTAKIQYIRYYLVNNDLNRQVIHYYFATDVNTWVKWNALDQYGNPPKESIDEDTVRADKISSVQFYGTDLVNITIVAANQKNSYTYQTQTLGRNIQ